MAQQKGNVIHHVGMIPYDMNVGMYRTYMDMSFEGVALSGASPWTFTGWADETLSWKETCYLGAVLNPTMITRVKEAEDMGSSATMKDISWQMVFCFAQQKMNLKLTL